MFNSQLVKKLMLASTALLYLALSGCFTGIESTPKITDKEVKKSGIIITPEQQLADSLTQRSSFFSWQNGRKFISTNNRVTLIFSQANTVSASDTLVYIDVLPVRSYTGQEMTTLRFRDNKGDTLNYRVNSSVGELMSREQLSIPFLVDLNDVAYVNSMLKGRQLYVMTNLRVNEEGGDATGRKFIPVTVSEVTAGDENFPLRVTFVTDDGKTERVKMTYGNERRAVRNFNTLFSFNNPRLKYPSISDETWNCIVNSRIVEGMTREEARLALGAPKDVQKAQNGSVFVEQWTYDDGRYLIFEDNLLKTFRL